jgi:two-component system cell cycle response regulator
VAETLTANIRASDTAARLGGDEMVVVMPDTDQPTARAIARRLVEVVAEIDMHFNGEAAGPISVSGGLAALVADDDSIDSLLSRADAALYQAKAMGRNQIVEVD